MSSLDGNILQECKDINRRLLCQTLSITLHKPKKTPLTSSEKLSFNFHIYILNFHISCNWQKLMDTGIKKPETGLMRI